MDNHRGERRSERRVHLSEAAALLGVSKDAVRMRVKRGTLRSEKGADGRVYVWVTADPQADSADVHSGSQAEAWRELIGELRDRVRSLEESNRENRRIIAALTQRIPELPPPSSEAPREEPDTAPAEPVEPAPSEPARDDALEATQTRSWWRGVSAVDYLMIWSVLAAVGALWSAMILVGADYYFFWEGA